MTQQNNVIIKATPKIIKYNIIINIKSVNLNNLNFHPPEVMFRYRDPQHQVGKNYSYLYANRDTFRCHTIFL